MPRRKPRTFSAVAITDALTDGQGFGRIDDTAVAVPGAVPGDVVTVTVARKRKGMWVGRLEAIEAPSADRIEPQCAHFGACGGCKWQMLAYDTQLHYKQQQVQNALERIAKVGLPELQPILPSPAVFGYRNKVEYSFSDRRWLTEVEIARQEAYDFRVLGYHAPGSFDKVLEIDTCWLHPSNLNALRNELLRYAREKQLTFWNAKEHTGWLRNLLFRTSVATNEVMCVLIVAYPDAKSMDPLFTHLQAEFPWVTSWLWIENPKLNDSFTDLPYHSWYGPTTITEKLGAYAFSVSPVSFFQTNTHQAKRLYDVVYQALPDNLTTLYDLYCGAGSIGIYCQDKARRIIGVEYVKQAVVDAEANAARNGLTHFTFEAGDLAKLLTADLVERHGTPEAVIVDPPRAGLEAKVCEALLALAPPLIVYVSCKPATQARDIAQLSSQYAIRSVQPVDMFPHTAHVENVVVLQAR